MDILAAYNGLQGQLGAERVLRDEPMSLHTTFGVGGPADIFIMPESAEDVAKAAAYCRSNGIPLLVLGNGSNLLVRDGGVRGAVMGLGECIARITAEGTVLKAEAGALLSKVAAEAYRLNLTGMEFASGIPGSVGGAAAMNAGAYGGEMKDIVQSVTAVTTYSEFVKYSGAEMGYSYRHSRALDERLIIVEVELKLQHGDMAHSKALMDDYARRRGDKQPLEMPSAGSFFKRPPGCFAGPLIEQAGLKGFSVGGAQVSEKHAGFIVNKGGATAADIFALAEVVKARVREASGVELEMEVRTVGEDR
jgi:UDP-N-acetylmuramate dehydrogenase